MPPRLARFLAIALATLGLSAGTGAGVAAASEASANQGGVPAADHTARDDHRPAGVGTGRKIG